MKFVGIQWSLVLAALSVSQAFVVKSPFAVSPPPRRSRVTTAPFSSSSSTALNAGIPTILTNLVPNVDGGRLVTLLAESVIQTAVPTAAVCTVIGFAANAFRNKDNNNNNNKGVDGGTAVGQLYSDLYGNHDDTSQSNNFFKKFGGNDSANNQNNKNLGIPSREYIKITNVNSKLDSYRYSMTAATQSKAKAAAQVRQTNFERALQIGMDSSLTELSPHAKTSLLQAEEEFLKEGAQLVGTIGALQTALTQSALQDELKTLLKSSSSSSSSTAQADRLDPPNAVVDVEIVKDEINNTTKTGSSPLLQKQIIGKSQLLRELSKAQRSLTQLELQFVKKVVACVGPDRATGVSRALLGDIATRGAGNLLSQLQERPLVQLLHADENGSNRKKPSLYVASFPGDVSASQVAELREEVTAICRSAREGDEALVVLQSGGGTVTGYGLAAAQLQRLKNAGLKLTICVEQVAASGGYMMCCVADRIVASPFAVLGSIGVITDIPNVYERLKEEGIEFQTVTAGKFKRTLTPTKKVTKEDFAKTKEDVEEILGLFKDFVHQNRPCLDMEKVATGETWFGTDALKMGLCDEIKTADEVLTQHVDNGYNVYEVKYSPPPQTPELSKLLPIGVESDTGGDGPIGRAIKWLVKTVAAEIKSEFGGAVVSDPVERRYMMLDDTAEKIRAQD